MVPKTLDFARFSAGKVLTFGAAKSINHQQRSKRPGPCRRLPDDVAARMPYEWIGSLPKIAVGSLCSKARPAKHTAWRGGDHAFPREGKAATQHNLLQGALVYRSWTIYARRQENETDTRQRDYPSLRSRDTLQGRAYDAPSGAAPQHGWRATAEMLPQPSSQTPVPVPAAPALVQARHRKGALHTMCISMIATKALMPTPLICPAVQAKPAGPTPLTTEEPWYRCFSTQQAHSHAQHSMQGAQQALQTCGHAPSMLQALHHTQGLARRRARQRVHAH